MSAFESLLLLVLAAGLLFLSSHVRTLQRELRFARAKNHVVCLSQVKDLLSADHDADLLRGLADRWDSVSEQHHLIILGRERYKPGGPSMPALWLREQADRIEQAAD